MRDIGRSVRSGTMPVRRAFSRRSNRASTAQS
jgi:hypothetical protein